ncbi:MAG: hypothetical protein P8174_07685, partial [Gemmatimonadota bacterium]
MSSPDDAAAATLGAVAEKAQRALRDRPRLSIRARLSVGLSLWFVLSMALTLVSIMLIGRVQAKLRILGAVDRYTFEIQQARRFEKNFFLYHTNLQDALDQVHASQDILDQNMRSMSSVVGAAAVQVMSERVRRYEQLLVRLQGLDPTAQAPLANIEAELRLHGAEMVSAAEDLATQERRSVESMLVAAQRIAVVFLGVLLLLIL